MIKWKSGKMITSLIIQSPNKNITTSVLLLTKSPISLLNKLAYNSITTSALLYKITLPIMQLLLLLLCPFYLFLSYIPIKYLPILSDMFQSPYLLGFYNGK